jgi:hypothetical protein
MQNELGINTFNSLMSEINNSFYYNGEKSKELLLFLKEFKNHSDSCFTRKIKDIIRFGSYNINRNYIYWLAFIIRKNMEEVNFNDSKHVYANLECYLGWKKKRLNKILKLLETKSIKENILDIGVDYVEFATEVKKTIQKIQNGETIIIRSNSKTIFNKEKKDFSDSKILLKLEQVINSKGAVKYENFLKYYDFLGKYLQKGELNKKNSILQRKLHLDVNIVISNNSSYILLLREHKSVNDVYMYLFTLLVMKYTHIYARYHMVDYTLSKCIYLTCFYLNLTKNDIIKMYKYTNSPSLSLKKNINELGMNIKQLSNVLKEIITNNKRGIIVNEEIIKGYY